MDTKFLRKHILSHKDAVIIIGPEVIKNLQKSMDKEEYNKYCTKKFLKRDPEKFWKFFNDNIFIDLEKNQLSKTEKNIIELYDKNLLLQVINQNTDGLLAYQKKINNLIQLHGNSLVYKCSNRNCNNKVSSMNYKNNTMPKCNICGANLEPDILLVGENYNQKDFNILNHSILETHTLILVGVDYTESLIEDLIEQYNCNKPIYNTKEENTKITIVIHEKELNFNINEELGFCDFIVKDYIDDAMDRLVKILS